MRLDSLRNELRMRMIFFSNGTWAHVKFIVPTNVGVIFIAKNVQKLNKDKTENVQPHNEVKRGKKSILRHSSGVLIAIFSWEFYSLIRFM